MKVIRTVLLNSSRRALVVLGAFALIFGGSLGLASATPTGNPGSSPFGIQSVYFQIRAQHSGKCLDVTGGIGATGDGVPVQQWTCLGSGQLNQLWQLVDTGDGVTYYVKAFHSGKCLDVRGGTAATGDGVPVQQWTCLGYGQSNQRWDLNYAGGNYYYLSPAHAPDKCLDVTGGTAATGDGVPVQQWACLGSAQTNQKWLLLSS